MLLSDVLPYKLTTFKSINSTQEGSSRGTAFNATGMASTALVVFQLYNTLRWLMNSLSNDNGFLGFLFCKHRHFQREWALFLCFFPSWTVFLGLSPVLSTDSFVSCAVLHSMQLHSTAATTQLTKSPSTMELNRPNTELVSCLVTSVPVFSKSPSLLATVATHEVMRGGLW